MKAPGNDLIADGLSQRIQLAALPFGQAALVNLNTGHGNRSLRCRSRLIFS